MKILYIARQLTTDHPQLDGRSLYRHLNAENSVRLCGAIASSESSLLAGGHQVDAVLSTDQLGDFDAIYMEGGWNDDRAGTELRLPTDVADQFVRQGGQLLVADVNRHSCQQQSFQDAHHVLHASAYYGKNVFGNEGVQYFYDRRTDEGSGRQRFPTGEMAVSEWLRPALEGIDSLMSSDPVFLDGGSLAATGSATTQILVRDEFVDFAGHPWPWAFASPHGLGHVVVIGGNISHDTLVDACPDNARWISNLIALLADRTDETTGWLQSTTLREETLTLSNDEWAAALGKLAEDHNLVERRLRELVARRLSAEEARKAETGWAKARVVAVLDAKRRGSVDSSTVEAVV